MIIQFFLFLGKEEIFQHSIQLNAELYTPVDGELIPSGEILSVANTEFDLRIPNDQFRNFYDVYSHVSSLNS